jgi:hypothetical protein
MVKTSIPHRHFWTLACARVTSLLGQVEALDSGRPRTAAFASLEAGLREYDDGGASSRSHRILWRLATPRFPAAELPAGVA